MTKRTRLQRRELRLKAARARERSLPMRENDELSDRPDLPWGDSEKAGRRAAKRDGGAAEAAPAWPVWAKVLLFATVLVAILAVLSQFRGRL